MEVPRVTMFDIEVASLTMQQTIDYINMAMSEGQQLVHGCINAYIVVIMNHNPDLKARLRQADIINADGQAIVWASHLYPTSLPERVPGPDLMMRLFDLAYVKGYKTFLLGAEQNIVKMVADHYNSSLIPGIVAGYRNGYFKESEELEIVNQINQSGAQMLFVAIPSPAKEIFLNKYRAQLPNVLLLMGVGGTFDIIAGKIQRAPVWLQKIGLEWLFRLIQEPRKMWRRYLIGNIKFIVLLLKNILKRGT